jgi:hypothetical protein
MGCVGPLPLHNIGSGPVFHGTIGYFRSFILPF